MSWPLPTPSVDAGVNGRWDVNAVPDGIEPLVLPPADAHDALRDAGDPPARGAWYAVRAATDSPTQPVRGADVDDDDLLGRLFWYRWITGHQVTFVVWRLMGQLLDDIAGGRAPADAALPVLGDYVRTCTAMLLYSGSCPREVYKATIRPVMRRWHLGFSGSWARDHAVVRDLLRGRPTAAGSGVDAPELRDAVRLHTLAHKGIAAKLVPDGRSLLSRAPEARLDRRTEALLYDSFFATSRAAVGRPDAVEQLLRRLVAIARDVAANGLHPAADGAPLPDQLLGADVAECTHGIGEILVTTARSACGDVRYEHGERRPTMVAQPWR